LNIMYMDTMIFSFCFNNIKKFNQLNRGSKRPTMTYYQNLILIGKSQLKQVKNGLVLFLLLLLGSFPARSNQVYLIR